VENPRQLALELAATLRARALYQGARRVRPPGTGGEVPESDAAEAGAEMTDGGTTGRDWEALREEALACTLCGLCETRTNVVFGEGDPAADLMFVGEAPGADEDRQGRPFVGRAGQLLTKMIEGMGMAREDVFIANVLKCRPPNNRDPAADEVEKCRPYLLRQIDHIEPKVICALGRHALRTLTGYTGGITKVRGRPMEFHGRIVIPTFHPAYLLRNPAAKRDAWEDLKAVLRLLGRPVPEVRRAPRR
jgi:DNA polymerase